MRIGEAQDHLLALLREEGQEPGRLSPLPAWRAFSRFMHRPIEAVEDALLYEFGTYSFRGPRRFCLSFCRQADVDEGREPAFTAFLNEIEHRPEWPVITALQPVDSFVYQERVC
ncbi:hypothetical protein [Actinomadura macrotermitis]|uniref:Uncharacterized protein n=1 Tax=Actinomadura macrotermitis TaxID=2585200 RepID=A0A7K0BVR2_9ACTN|nr:hypothetical protein [Actinomadura macrotermitis]MQY05265.1 hypothetical protein [Actinomadura macrotermitis]